MHVYKSCLKYAHLFRLLRYNVGASIHPHTDWMDFVHASCTINLNDSYSGGEFVFFNGQIEYKLGVGDALIFPADCFWVHEVKAITEGSRYSTNTFLMSIPYQKALGIGGFKEVYGNEDTPFKF
jgi:predicted 2-oxoglutarate/Fe(II)-dependent dioxygenase YbiX